MFALVVSLKVNPGMRGRFLEAAEENSAASLREEPGCLRFDVVQDNHDPDHYLFYELYQDEAAFQAHRSTPHFARWRQAAAVCLQDGSQVNTYCTVVVPSEPGRPHG
jgi:autoinducer 2-degrading protein